MRIKIFLIALFTAAPLYAQQPSSKAAQTQSQLVRLASAADTVQYTLGAYIGQWFQKNGFAITNRTLFERGLDDVLQNKKLALADTIIAPLVTSYQLTVQNARSRALEEQLFAGLKGKPGVGATPNGVHYIVVKTGSGIRPAPADTIVFNTIGILPDGTVFEDTYQKKKAITTLTANLIPGLAEAIQLMPEGSTWRIFVPSVLGYGPSGLPNIIPPNTALIFDINLMEVRTKK